MSKSLSHLIFPDQHHLEFEKRFGIRKKDFFFGRILEICLFETLECLFEIHVGKVRAEKGLVLKPAADRFQKDFRKLLRQISRRVNVDVLLVRQHADQFLLPRPARMRRNDFHSWKISGQAVEMNGATVVESNAASAI